MPAKCRQTTVYFVRHGQFKRFMEEPDAGLTELGRHQAQITGRFLAALTIAAVYTSDARRTLETAALIADTCNCQPAVDLRLRERADYSPSSGMSVADFVAMWARANVERSWQPPIGDSADACGERMALFAAVCARDYSGRNVVAISHGGAIADMLHVICARGELTALKPELAARPYDGTLLRECSVTTVGVDDVRVQLIDVASTAHLQAE